jgi:outer membrane lipoprotein-sorting protein
VSVSAIKWTPSAVIAAVMAAGVIAVPLQANAANLPEKSAEDIIALMALEPVAFSGTVLKTTDLGLPELEMSSLVSDEMVAQMEETMPEGFEDFIPQLIDDNTITEAISSNEGLRAQILDPLSQRDVVVNANEAWGYNAKTQTATHVTFEQPLDSADWDDAAASLEVDLSNPNTLTAYVLEQAGPNTTVTVGDPRTVAGRASYTLVLEPNDSASLVDYVTLSIDSETGLGLCVQVFSTQQESVALVVEFETLNLSTPDASLFSFRPPPGATIEEPALPADFEASLRQLASGELDEGQKEAFAGELFSIFGEGLEPRQIGEGWGTVMALNNLPASFPREMLESELLSGLTLPVLGGTVLSTPLVNVLVTDSGEVYAGALTVRALLDIAAG